MAIKLKRDYDSKGIISAGAMICVYDDTLAKYILLVPTTDMPAGPGAPDTIDNPILTTSYIGQVEGKQTLEQKEYTINWSRDNIRRLNKYSGKPLSFLEIDGQEYTGRKFNGTLTFDKDSYSDNAIMPGKVWITVTEDLGYVDDVRDIYAETAIITSPLPEQVISGTATATVSLKTSASATVTATSEATSVATATINVTTGNLEITGVAAGHTIVKLVCSATGEASSERTILVTVI